MIMAYIKPKLVAKETCNVVYDCTEQYILI